MEYVFGTKGETEILRTKGSAHTALTGFHTVVQVFPDQNIIDTFRIVRKYDSQEDVEGNCYDWYEIDSHYRTQDREPFVETRMGPLENVAGIAFVTLAEAGSIDGETAGEHADLFAEWAFPVVYAVGNLRVDPEDGALYRCVQAHTSQEDWAPHLTPALWARAADPAEEWPAWSQPIGASDAYMQGDKVCHNEKRWISEYDNNVWEPGVFGWTEANGE